MKRFICLISVVAFIAAAASCSSKTLLEQSEKEILQEEVPAPEKPGAVTGNEGEYERLTMTAGDFIWDTPVTKTTLDDMARFFWKSDDVVGVIPDVGTQVKFPINADEGTQAQSAEFNGGAWGLKRNNRYMAYYPFISDMELDKTAIPVDYRNQRQNGSGNTGHLSNYDFMSAAGLVPSNGSLDFTFDHLSSLLRLNLTVPKASEYKTLTLSCADVPFITGGVVDITAATPHINGTHSSHEFIINLSNVITTAANQQVVIYVLIPPVDMSGHRIHVRMSGDHAACETWFDRGENKPFQPGHAYQPTMSDMAGGDVVLLEDGPSFNVHIKSLANNNPGYIYDDNDYSIKHIRFETGNTTVPSQPHVDVSAPESPSPIYAFWDASTSTLIVRTPALKVYANSDASGMFNNLYHLEDVDFTGFDLEYCSSVGSFFRGCVNLTALDLSPWNTGNVEYFGFLLSGCNKLTSLDISRLDTRSATSIEYMFNDCCSLTSIDASHFDTSLLSGYAIDGLFSGCNSLNDIDFGSDFDTSNIESFNSVFQRCSSLESLDVSIFDMRKSGGYNAMFEGCSSLRTITGDIPVDNGDALYHMFNGCSSLESIDVSDWDVSRTTDMSYLFCGCSSLTSLDVSNWDVSKVLDMNYLFSGFGGTSLDLGNWHTSSAVHMDGMFMGCNNLESLTLSNNFVTDNVTSMVSMFENCPALTALHLGGFNTAKVESFEYMFSGCSSLASLDVSVFNTSSATNFDGMFNGCSSIASLNVTGFNTSNAQNLRRMFMDCSSLNSLDVSSFDTSAARDLMCMFAGCTSLQTITGIGGFNTGFCTDFSEMFRDCSSLTSLDLSGWNTLNATSMDYTFQRCLSLASLNLTGWDTSNVSSMTDMFTECKKISELWVGSGFSPTGSNIFLSMSSDVPSVIIHCSQTFKDNSGFDGTNGPDNSKVTWLDIQSGSALN